MLVAGLLDLNVAPFGRFVLYPSHRLSHDSHVQTILALQDTVKYKKRHFNHFRKTATFNNQPFPTPDGSLEPEASGLRERGAY